ncbi:MAG: hypothetical protein IJ131_00745 [Eggerthellaceae bacterium]|nr:hypothetical protein [Eggerthellaceae bacterium]
MIRRRHGRALARSQATEEDVNPSANVVNIADCMLVLMLGILVALISHYGLDLTQPMQPVDENEDIVGIEVNLDADDDGEIDSGYERQGVVYYDPATERYYFVDGER